MGLDSCVKTYLRKHVPAAFGYFQNLSQLYENRKYDVCIVDMNVELFRKPPHVTTGMQWAEYVFRARVRAPPGNTCILLFDAPSRVPATKDMTHLKRSAAGAKRKRTSVPLSADTKFGDNIELPEWSRVTSSKSVLPALWMYLIDALKRIASTHPDFNKTFYIDAPMSTRHRPLSKYMDGGIHCLHCLPSETRDPPKHRFGEGDLKTFAWVMHIKKENKDAKILIWSTDLDNIGMFARPDMPGVDLIGNTVAVDNANKIVPKKNSTKKVYEIIGLGAIASGIGARYDALFRTILVMGSTDFNTSVDSITTSRMLNTFFEIRRQKRVLDADSIISDYNSYCRFRSMCYSKVYKNRGRPSRFMFDPQKKVDPYLSRCRWIRDYWRGVEQALGGPLPGRGWEKPTDDMDLGEYKGRVRLVPV